MNFDNVKYPVIVIKLKPDGIELQGWRLLTVPMGIIDRLTPILARFLQKEKHRAIQLERTATS